MIDTGRTFGVGLWKDLGKKLAARFSLQGRACRNRAPMKSDLLNHAPLPWQRSDSRKADRFSLPAGITYREQGYDPAIEPKVMDTLLSGKISVQQARASHEEQESGLSPVIFCYSLIIEHILTGSSLPAPRGWGRRGLEPEGCRAFGKRPGTGLSMHRFHPHAADHSGS